MKKKVIQLIHGMSMGGAETLVKDYCLGIDKNKFDIILLCLTHCEGPYEQMLEDAGIKIIYIEDLINKKIFNSNFKLIKALKKIQIAYFIRKILRKEKPNIIHSHLSLNKYIYYSNLDKNTKIIHTVHNEPKVLWNNELHTIIDKFCLNKLQKKYDTKFIVLHEDMKKEIEKIFNTNKVIVLNNGIDFTKYEKLPSKKSIREKNNIPENAFIIGHIGRFNEQKNHKFLINVFEEYLKLNQNSHLLLIGAGELKQDIINLLKEKKIESKTTILSNRSDIPELLKAMDCFVFPSIYEGLGIVLIESQKSGLKTIISDTIPKYAIISNLVKRISLEKSPKYWAKQIQEFNIEKIKYKDLESWNMKNVIKKLEEIYMEEKYE